VLALEVMPCEQGWTVQLRVNARRFAALKERRRTLAGRTGCGLCGVESLALAVQPVQPLATSVRFDARAVQKALAALGGHQALRAATGATHAAGWARADGQLVLVREDVGRHNALDKLLGALLHEGLMADQGFVVITSRASYEMVSKSARVGVALVAAVSGVTGLAIDVAQQAGVALAGFARGQNLTLYANAHRIRWGDPEDDAQGPTP
jgi:formate dehydrogenase accessory protein FdhD